MIQTLKYKPVPQSGPNPITEAIAYATGAYEETWLECADLPTHQRAAAAILAYRCCLPTLEDIASIRAFIACIASAQNRRWFTPDEARALMYTAQLALTAWQEGAGKRQRCNFPKGA